MKKIFSYALFNDETADTLVSTFNTLVEKNLEGKKNTPEYQTANGEFNDKLMKFCVESIPGAVYTGVDMVKNPMVHKNLFFTEKFNTVMAQAITPAVPTVASSSYDALYDVNQVGFGDNAKYTVDSNELFIVNDAAEGIARGGVQTTYNSEYTVTASRKQIAISVDWYHVAS